MLVRLDPGVLIAVGCGERDEAASQVSAPGVAHTLTIEEPPDTGGPRQPELPLA
jgi:hypothetical protein